MSGAVYALAATLLTGIVWLATRIHYRRRPTPPEPEQPGLSQWDRLVALLGDPQQHLDAHTPDFQWPTDTPTPTNERRAAAAKKLANEH